MRRTVKAWAKITKRGVLCLAWDDVTYLVTPTRAAADNRVAVGEVEYRENEMDVVPVTITFDDQRPAQYVPKRGDVVTCDRCGCGTGIWPTPDGRGHGWFCARCDYFVKPAPAPARDAVEDAIDALTSTAIVYGESWAEDETRRAAPKAEVERARAALVEAVRRERRA